MLSPLVGLIGYVDIHVLTLVPSPIVELTDYKKIYMPLVLSPGYCVYQVPYSCIDYNGNVGSLIVAVLALLLSLLYRNSL